MRTLIIGDIHGCIEELKELLNTFKPTKADEIYSVGDIISRGQDSKSCIDILQKFNVKPVLGNHEYWYLKRYPFNDDSKWGKAFKSLNLREEDLEWFKSLPLFIEKDEFIIVHAGFDPRIDFERNNPQTIVSVRNLTINCDEIPWYELYKGKKQIYFGHWAALGLNKTSNTLCLDSGCVYGKFLTGYVIEENKFIKIPAKKIYHAIHKYNSN